MEIITREELIKTIAERFNRNGTSKELYNILRKLKSKKQIDELIGNTSWTDNICHNCSLDNEITIKFYTNNMSEPIYLCQKCLREALNLINNNKINNTNVSRLINL